METIKKYKGVILFILTFVIMFTMYTSEIKKINNEIRNESNIVERG